MFVQIEEVLDLTKPPAHRRGTGMLLCLTRCRVRKQDDDTLILFSVSPHDAKDTAFEVGVNVAIWEPFEEMSRVYLCTRFVLLRD